MPAATAPVSAHVPAKTWIAIIAATLGAFMAILNIQIVNASLADIQGAIGAGIDDGGWISTSYLIAEIVVIPLSGWLAQVFSIRVYLLTNAILFLILSAACALAQDLLPGRVGMVAGMFFGFSFGLGGLGAAALGQIADWTSIDTVYRLCSFLPLIGLLTAFLPNIERRRS
mgnify:CR=1 FL=1